jgi:hypothetical protein
MCKISAFILFLSLSPPLIITSSSSLKGLSNLSIHGFYIYISGGENWKLYHMRRSRQRWATFHILGLLMK